SVNTNVGRPQFWGWAQEEPFDLDPRVVVAGPTGRTLRGIGSEERFPFSFILTGDMAEQLRQSFSLPSQPGAMSRAHRMTFVIRCRLRADGVEEDYPPMADKTTVA